MCNQHEQPAAADVAAAFVEMTLRQAARTLDAVRVVELLSAHASPPLVETSAAIVQIECLRDRQWHWCITGVPTYHALDSRRYSETFTAAVAELTCAALRNYWV